MQTKEIMCREDFEREFHVRLADKCCANCKHGAVDTITLDRAFSAWNRRADDGE